MQTTNTIFCEKMDVSLKNGFKNLKYLTDKELIQWSYLAEELRNGEYIMSIKNEINRRHRDE